MGKNIAVDGAKLELSSGDGIITITSVASTNVKIDGKGVYEGQIIFTVSGFTGGDIKTPKSGAGGGSIDGTSLVKVNGQPFVLEGDNVSVTLIGTKPSGNSTVPASETVTVKVKNAGQSKVTAN